MKIFFIIFTLTLIFSFINSENSIEYDLTSGIVKTISIKKNITYNAFIEASHGQKINFELSLDYASFQKSPFKWLYINEYMFRNESGESYDDATPFSENIKNNKLILSGEYIIKNIFASYISLEFISFYDISNLEIKISVGGLSTGKQISLILILVIIIPILVCCAVCIGILAFCLGCCDPHKPRPQYTVQTPVYTPLQPQPQPQQQPQYPPQNQNLQNIPLPNNLYPQ